MYTYTNRRFTSSIMARLMGSACFITANPDGSVTPTGEPMTVTVGGEVASQGPVKEVSSKDAPADPHAPPETDEAKAARVTAERAAMSPEERQAAEAKDAEDAAEVTRRAALTEEERAAEDKAKETEVAAAEAEAKNKAWAERDTAKDVPVSEEQKAQIAKLAKTPEQIAAMEEFTLETNTTNDLSPASRAKAAALWNVTPEMVDQYVASVIAQNKGVVEGAAQYDDTSEDRSKWSPQFTAALTERLDALYEVAGGEDNWNQFSAWANENMPPKALQALQDAISASAVVGATVAKTMIARWQAEGNGGGPVDLSRGTGTAPKAPTAAVQPFASKAEQNAAINDPRYAKDSAYRATVDARMVASSFQAGQEQRIGAMM